MSKYNKNQLSNSIIPLKLCIFRNCMDYLLSLPPHFPIYPANLEQIISAANFASFYLDSKIIYYGEFPSLKITA